MSEGSTPRSAEVPTTAQGRVVVGIDGSEDGARAVAYGVRSALRRQIGLLLAHAVDDAVLAGAWGVVYDPGVLQKAGRQAADDARAQAISLGMDPADVTAEIYLGNPGAVLTRLSEDAPLVVVGRRAMSGLERLFVGSTSVGIAATAHCPVIMVSAASHREETGDLGVVGVGVDGTERSRAAVAYAFEEADRRSARLRVIHGYELSSGFFADRQNREDRIRTHEKAAREGIAALLRQGQLDYPRVEIETVINATHPVKTLTDQSDALDLLVLGVHGVGLPGLSPGATIRAVMAHGHCPLALVRDHRASH